MAPQSPNEALQPEAPPPPPPRRTVRRRPTLSALSGFVSFLVIVALAALAALAYGSSRLREPGPLPADRLVYILPHTDLPDIIEKLDADGVIDSPLTMNVVLAVERKRKKVKAGEYLFKEHASLREVIDVLVSGKQYQHRLTIPEGLTTQQIVQRLRDSDLLAGEVREMPKEGALMPETYKVSRGMTRSDLIAKMSEDNRRMVEQIWAKRAPDLPLRSPFDMLTLASIVEKETGKADERPRVAAVFVNRLRKHMRLQSDPTIVYGLVGGQGTLGHSITRSELDKRTGYNTYQIDGLPPGPIDNPGRAALEAVANPLHTTELYFVADGTGGHVFSDTLEGHNRNVQHWRQVERDGKAKGEVDKLAPNAAPDASSAPAGPGRGNQRSELDPSFGALPTRVASASLGSVASFTDPSRNHDIDRVFEADRRGPVGHAGAGKRMAPAMPDPASYSHGLDQFGLAFNGPAAASGGASLLDGPPTLDAPGAAAVAGAAMPASAATTAAAAPDVPRGPAAATMTTASLDAGATGHPDLFGDGAGDVAAASAKVPPAHPKIFDASENTSFDPLKNRNFDLNTAKTIPVEMIR